MLLAGTGSAMIPSSSGLQRNSIWGRCWRIDIARRISGQPELLLEFELELELEFELELELEFELWFELELLLELLLWFELEFELELLLELLLWFELEFELELLLWVELDLVRTDARDLVRTSA